MDPSTILSVRDLTKTITLHLLGGKQVPALRGVSFDVREGEFVGIVGLSGAGKSSLAKCIYRTYLATGGAILYRSADDRVIDLVSADDRTILDLRRREIRYVSQFLKAPPRTPAVEVVAMPLLADGMDPAAARARAGDLLRRLNIPPELVTSYPSLFSGGEQQRVNVARALARPARLLLLDEPTSALDAENRAGVLELLREARDAGTTIIGVFHDGAILSRLADRVIVMEGGRIVTSGSVDAVNIDRYTGSVADSVA